MSKLIAFLFLIIFSASAVSQISISVGEINFPQTLTSGQETSAFYLINKSSQSTSVKVKSFTKKYILNDSVFNLNARDSILLSVIYKPTTNIEDNDLLVFETADLKHSAVVVLKGSGKFGDNYDAVTFNKFDTDLKSAINSLTINHTVLGYTTARNRMFENIDKQPGDTIECVYSGTKVKAATRTEAQNQGFDTEHTWPQGFFNSADPMVSDINHLFPTTSSANNTRGNLPFGVAVSGIDYNVGGSKRGYNSVGVRVFEPRDIHKGNVARCMLYFILRYTTNYGNFLDAGQESVFRSWNKTDPVDTRELNRNTGIQTYQGKRNPLIDHPDFVDRIYSFTSTAVSPKTAVVNITPSALFFENATVGSPLEKVFYVYNSGTKDFNVTGGSINGNGFEAQITPVTVTAKGAKAYTVKYTAADTSTVSGSLTIQTTEGNINISLSGSGSGATDVNDYFTNISGYALSQNYPNPFNPVTVINFSVPNTGKKEQVILKVYDMLGKEISTLFNDYVEGGKYQINFDGSGLNSGIYFYRIRSGNYYDVKRMALIK